MDLNQLYRNLFEAVAVGGVRNVAKIASLTCGQPVILTDAAFHILGIYPSTPQNDYIWDTMLEKGYAPQEMVMSFYNEKYMEFANSNPSSTLANWGSLTEKPRVMTPILIKGIVEGYAGMMCPNELYTPDYDEAIKAIAKAAAIEMERSADIGLAARPLAKVFISNLFNNLVLTGSQLSAWQNTLGLPEKMHCRLLGIRPFDPAGQGVLKYLISVAAASYPQQISLIREGTLYVLVFSSSEDFNQTELENLLKSFHAFCGISSDFSDLLKFGSYRQQVDILLEVMTKLHPDRTIFEYDRYAFESVLCIARKYIDYENYAAPEIRRLREFDRENNTDYLDTLRVYLKAMENSGNSAAALHIHRNTLLYRINKIEEILSVDLSDSAVFMKLMLSFHLMTINTCLNEQNK